MMQAPVNEISKDSESSVLESLNPLQREAVTHGEGPLLILAGAGTGKTSVITKRIAWLISQKRARPSEILALTFTDKAAAEMEERVDRLVPYGFADVPISTFHSFGRRLVSEYALLLGLPREPGVLSEAEALVFLREHLYQIPLRGLRPLVNPTKHLAALLTLVNRARDEAVSPEAYASYAQGLEAAAVDDADRELAAEQLEVSSFYSSYLELLDQNGLCDYGQLLWLALRLLNEHARVRREVSQRYKYILVDEFQDTNIGQFQFLQALCDRHHNITVVGDDDQSIYQFRGASYSNLLQFLKTYPETKRIVLLDNYRSTQSILDASHRLIKNNDPDRLEVQAGIDKRLRAVREYEDSRPPEVEYFDTASSEAEWVAEEIKTAVQGGGRWSDHAVLVRTHLSAKPILQTFGYRGLPFRYVASRGLYDTDEVRLCEQLLRAVADPGDSPAHYELAAGEVYELPAADLAKLSGLAYRRRRPLHEIFESAVLPTPEQDTTISEAGRTQLQRMIHDLSTLRRLATKRPSGEVLYRFLERSGWLERLTSSNSQEDESKVQNLAEFFNILRDYADLADSDRVIHFVRHLELLRESGDNPSEAEPDLDQDAVAVLTVHRAKGLEFPSVYMVGLEEGRFPMRRRSDPFGFPDALRQEQLPTGDPHIEEERRLFYVAMTRAQQRLVLSTARDLGGKRMHKPSRFLLEALDSPALPAGPKKTSAAEALVRHAPDLEEEAGEIAPLNPEDTLYLSYDQIGDYQSCPQRYKYGHVMRVPLLPHHSRIYGLAIHNAIRAYYRQILNGWPATESDVLAEYAASWKSEGFVTREHEEARYAAGTEVLRRFCEREEGSGVQPHSVERDFRFRLGNDVIRGRFDRIDLRDEGPVIVDFKTSDVRSESDAEKRTKESLQLKIYALAYREQYRTAPVSTELHFVESGILGRSPVTESTFEDALESIHLSSTGIRSREFKATPSYKACRICPFRQICPDSSGK